MITRVRLLRSNLPVLRMPGPASISLACFRGACDRLFIPEEIQMRSMRSDRPVLLKTSLAVFVLVAAALAAGPTRYSVAKTYPVGGDGGWDYFNLDPGADRVFFSRGTPVLVL